MCEGIQGMLNDVRSYTGSAQLVDNICDGIGNITATAITAYINVFFLIAISI